MALVLKDRVKETTTTIGTGNFQLQGAASGFRPFNDIGDSNFTYYAVITEAAIGEYEVGYGQFNLTTQQISRSIIISSSNNNNIVNFPRENRTSGDYFSRISHYGYLTVVWRGVLQYKITKIAIMTAPALTQTPREPVKSKVKRLKIKNK